MGGARLTADVVEHGADLRVEVWHLVHHLREAAQVVRVPSHVRGDERRLRMLAKQVVPLCHQRLEARKPVLRIATIRKQREFEPALIREIDRLEEFRRIGDVDEDRDLQIGGLLPHRIELRIVKLQPRAVGLLDAEPEIFHDFADAQGAF